MIVAVQCATFRHSADGGKLRTVRLLGKDVPGRQTRLEFARSLLTIKSLEYNSRVKNTIFSHGLLHKDTFLKVMDAHGKPPCNERQILCHFALTGDFRYVDEPLYHKVFYTKKFVKKDDKVLAAKESTGPWRELFDTLRAIARSPVVPFRLKVRAIPAMFFGGLRWRIFISPIVRMERLWLMFGPRRRKTSPSCSGGSTTRTPSGSADAGV